MKFKLIKIKKSKWVIMFSDKIIISLIISFLSANCYSQSKIFGIVTEKENNAIAYANVTLQNENSQVIVNYTSTDDKGSYKLSTNKIGKFILTFSALNYESISIPIELSREVTQINENATLKYKPTELNEVTIITERPITIKKDTIVFDAKAFAQGNERVVEDLLKKIPGLSISKEGTIKVGNQEVEKVMIEGDDFFEKGYQLLTKNMPANPIDKIELYQHYSKNKHLKGIEKSEKVALNLKLKEDAKRQWFGNMDVGYGLISNDRYVVRGNLMNFGKRNKYYFLTNLNNIGEEAISDINHLIRPYNEGEVIAIGDGQSANSLIHLSSQLPELKEKRINFNNAEMTSLNAIYNLTDKIKIKTLGFYYSDENDFFRNSFESFSVANISFQNTENLKLRNNKITGFGKLDLTYDISKTKTFNFIGKYNATNEDKKSNINFNGDLLNEKLQSNNLLLDQKIGFVNKFKSNKVFLLSGRYINEKTPQNYAANQFLYQSLFNQTANNLAQISENRMQFIGVDAHLLDRKKNGDLLEIRLGNQYREDFLLSTFSLKQDEILLENPVQYQNNLRYNTNDFFINSKYLFHFNNISLQTQADFHQLYNGLKTSEKASKQTPSFINPRVSLNWEINKKNSISTSYSFNKTNASILDVYSNYIHTGFRIFEKGLGNFNQLDASTITFNYSLGNWGEHFFANTIIGYTDNNDFYSTNSQAIQDYSKTDKIIIKDRENIFFSSNIDKYFKRISTNFKVILSGSKTQFKNIVNNSELRKVNTNSLNIGYELRSGFKGFFNYHIGTRWDHSIVNTTTTNSNTNNTSFLDLSFVFNDKFNCQIQTERYFFGNIDKNRNTYYFIDLESRYMIYKNKLSISLLGNNLFDTSRFIDYSISDTSISKSEYKIVSRYVLLKIEYHF